MKESFQSLCYSHNSRSHSLCCYYPDFTNSCAFVKFVSRPLHSTHTCLKFAASPGRRPIILPVSDDAQGFDGYVCHPQFGNEMVRGRFVMGWDGLRFESEQEPYILPLDQVVVELGNDENWIGLADRRQPGLTFFVARDILEESRFIGSLTIRRQLERTLGRRELFRRLRVTVIALLAFAGLAWIGSLGAGWAVQTIVKGISVEREIAFGDDSFKEVQEHLDFVGDTNAVLQLQAVAAPLLPSVPARGIPFKFYITTGEPNAFAMPGGRIFVTTGLLDLMDTPEQLAGVLAHESAHIARRHIFQHIISGRGPVYLVRLLTGNRNSMLNLMAIPSELLVYESFSQRYEKEADAYGWDYLVAAGINPHGMIEALKKLRDYHAKSGDDTGPKRGAAFSSHPDLDKRIAWLEAKWAALPDKSHFMTLTNPVPKVEENHKLIDLLLK